MKKSILDKKYIHVYQWLLSFLRGYFCSFFAVLLMILGTSVCLLFIPQYFNILLNYIIGSQREMFLFKISCLILLLTVIFIITLNVGKNIIQKNMQEKIFRQMHRLGIPYYERHNVGESLSYLTSEVDAIQDFYRVILPNIIQNMIFFFASIIWMFFVNYKLTVIYILSFSITYFINFSIGKKRAALTHELQEERKHLNQKIYGSLSAFFEVKAYNRENWEISRLEKEIIDFNNVFMKTKFYESILKAFKEAGVRVISIVIFLFSFYEILHGELTIGQFTAYLLYFASNVNAFMLMAANIIDQQFMVAQAYQLYSLCQQKPTIISGEKILNGIEKIDFENVSFSYNGANILNNLCFQIRKGEKIAFVGQSGCGKSSILKLLARFYDVSGGKILINNIPIQEYRMDDIRNSIGFMFQESYIFAETVLENIRIAKPDASYEEVVAAAKNANIHNDIMNMGKGYDTYLGERGSSISGGQKQRIALARLFLKNPDMIILDEATSALDANTEVEVIKAIDKLFQNKIIVTVAHRLNTIKNYDKIYFIDQGEIAESGSYDTLMQTGTYFPQFAADNVKNEVYESV